jgi:hypothetical protein
LDGWRTHNPIEDVNANGWCSDDIGGVFQLDGAYRYIKLAAWSPSGGLNEPEVDAVAGARRAIAIDIKPTSCRNPLNVKSKGVLPVAILGDESFDVTQVDPASVRLEGVAPLRWDREDVATPFEPYLGKQDAFDCTEAGPDGYLDLTLKFNSQEVVAALGAVNDGDVLVLQLTGNLMEEFGGNSIIGEDVVVILM